MTGVGSVLDGDGRDGIEEMVEGNAGLEWHVWDFSVGRGMADCVYCNAGEYSTGVFDQFRAVAGGVGDAGGTNECQCKV